MVSSRRHGRGGHIQYLVKWKGYLDAENQWIDWRDMDHAREAIAEFRNHNPDAVSHIKKLGSDEELVNPTSSFPFVTSATSMSNHGEDTVCEEGEVIETSQVEQTVPLPIPPRATPPVPTVPLFSISEQIEGNGPRQEAIMSALMRIWNTTFDHTFAENAADIDRVMVLGHQPMAETSTGEAATDSVILELGCIRPPGTCPPSVHHTTDTTTMTTAVLHHGRDIHSM